MNYSKPEVNTLGQAEMVIEQINHLKPPTSPFDGTQRNKLVPAYDLDE
jgi:hypothetical protein